MVIDESDTFVIFPTRTPVASNFAGVEGVVEVTAGEGEDSTVPGETVGVVAGVSGAGTAGLAGSSAQTGEAAKLATKMLAEMRPSFRNMSEASDWGRSEGECVVIRTTRVTTPSWSSLKAVFEIA
jgi:hypothetical protein